jgi:hypothetical protein
MHRHRPIKTATDDIEQPILSHGNVKNDISVMNSALLSFQVNLSPLEIPLGQQSMKFF